MNETMTRFLGGVATELTVAEQPIFALSITFPDLDENDGVESADVVRSVKAVGWDPSVLALRALELLRGEYANDELLNPANARLEWSTRGGPPLDWWTSELNAEWDAYDDAADVLVLIRRVPLLTR